MDIVTGVIGAIVTTISWVIFSTGGLFWLVLLLVIFQYHRLARKIEKIWNTTKPKIFKPVVWSTILGIYGGFLGSCMMLILGVTVDNSGITYIWPIAILLMLIHPRFLCFSYAGTIVSLSYLFLGWPIVDIPQLMALVGILHLVEANLISLGGTVFKVPITAKNKRGQTVGGFMLQQFWPIPLALLVVIPNSGGGGIDMPNWWPIIKGSLGAHADHAYALLPVVAALGYGDVAISNSPQIRSRRTALYLAIYSIVLISLSILASIKSILLLLPVLWASLGHELVIKIGQKEELEGRAQYVSCGSGLGILHVEEKGLGAKLGLKPTDVIYRINGQLIENKEQLYVLLGIGGYSVEIEYLRQGKFYTRAREDIPIGNKVGMFFYPAPSEQPTVVLHTDGRILKWYKKIKKLIKKLTLTK